MIRDVNLRWAAFLGAMGATGLGNCGGAVAANVLSPANGSTVTTATPTVSISLDSTPQPDGQPTEYSPLISIIGARNGTATTVAFCAGADQGSGTWACSDPAHPLASGAYLLTYTYTWHTCTGGPTIPGTNVQLPPTCNWLTSTGLPSTFTVAVPGSSSGSPSPTPPGSSSSGLDAIPPVVQAYRSYGSPGTTAKLLFSVRDNRGAARIAIVVGTGAGAVIKRITSGRVLARGGIGYLPWRVPIGILPGAKVFCVAAVDDAGNQAKGSCSTIVVN
jgi:hypothetical protein